MPHVDLIVDGIKYPSVTEVLGSRPKPWLDKWRAKWGKRAEQKTLAATAIGTAFHAGAEALSKNENHFADGRVFKMLGRFVEWSEAAGFKAKETELHVVSHTYKYQGTFDATGYLKDRPRTLTLFDWKTSAAIYPDMGLQLAAYALAYHEQTGREIKRGVIVLVSKSKRSGHKVTVKEFTLGKRLTRKFLGRLEEYRGGCFKAAA